MFILAGLLIGFAAAVPLGPVNVFIASQALKRDFLHGFLAAVTTAILDFLFCAVALIGAFQAKVNLKPGFIQIMKVVAGLIIILIAAKLIRDSKDFKIPGSGTKLPPAAGKPILGVLALYVTNPSLYIFWAAVAGLVTGHNIVGTGGWKAFAFAGACGFGALVWYSTLVHLLSKSQKKIQPNTFRKVLFILGLALVGFGVYTILSAFVTLPKL